MKWVVAVLLVLLVWSNGYWVYHYVDFGVTLSYVDQQRYDNNETRKQLMAMLPEIAVNLGEDQVVQIANKYHDFEGGFYEKDGCIWVGWLGLKFDSRGKLLSVSPSWANAEPDPCFPEY